jgi:hypothetical protein
MLEADSMTSAELGYRLTFTNAITGTRAIGRSLCRQRLSSDAAVSNHSLMHKSGAR